MTEQIIESFPSNKNRISYLTMACVVAALFVIAIHTNGCFWTFSMDHCWFVANILEYAFYFAVDMLFMIIGAAPIPISIATIVITWILRKIIIVP